MAGPSSEDLADKDAIRELLARLGPVSLRSYVLAR